MNFVVYSVTLFGLAYAVGQSRITLGARSALSRLVSVKPHAAHCSCGLGHPYLPGRDFSSPMTKCGDYATDYFYPFKWPLLLAECPACLSFWVGLAVSVASPSLSRSVVPPYFATPIMFAFLSCGSSAIIGLLTRIMEP